jgi:ribose transport system permease protein
VSGGTLALPRFLARLPADRLFVVVTRATALVALVVVLSLVSSHFFTFQNLMNVLRQASLQFILSAGLTLVILTAGIDLSVGAVLGLTACLGASLIVAGHVGLGITAALAAGLACGLANGLLVTQLRIPAFIATYGMLWIAHGLTYVFMKGEVIHGLDKSFRFIGAGHVGPIPAPVVAAALLLGVLYVLLHHTRLGRAIYAIGGNPVAARLSGMPVNRYLVIVYGLSGLLAAFAGLVVIARVNAADPGTGEELLLAAIAAVCLGGTSLFGGQGGIGGTVVGSLILALVINGMNLLNVSTFWQAGGMGLIVLAAVFADQVGGRRVHAVAHHRGGKP